MEGLAAEGDLRGLILDYRNNGGGILQEAVKILSMFVPKGTEVVTTRGRTDNKSFRTAADPILPELPLAVLVNGNTASAAEIVAGALQDLDRAVIVGQRSFGKGPRAIDPPARLQHLPEADHGQILHPLGPLHPGRRLLPGPGGGRPQRARLADPRIRHAGRPQGSTTAAASSPTCTPNQNTSAASP